MGREPGPKPEVEFKHKPDPNRSLYRRVSDTEEQNREEVYDEEKKDAACRIILR